MRKSRFTEAQIMGFLRLRSTSGTFSDIAFGVCYESSAQFSRKYARMFGVPPRQNRTLHAAE